MLPNEQLRLPPPLTSAPRGIRDPGGRPHHGRSDNAEVVPRKELEALEKRLPEQNEEALKRQQERDELDAEFRVLREQLAEIRAASEQKEDTHDYSEAETRRYLIDVELKRAGWPLDGPNDIEYEGTGMPNGPGIGYADFVLWGDDGKPLAVVEEKKTTADPQVGQQQAKLFAGKANVIEGTFEALQGLAPRDVAL